MRNANLDFVLLFLLAFGFTAVETRRNVADEPAAVTGNALTTEQKAALAAVDARLAGVEAIAAKIDDPDYKAEVARQIDELKKTRRAIEKNFDLGRYEALMHSVISRYQVIALWLKAPPLPPHGTQSPSGSRRQASDRNEIKPQPAAEKLVAALFGVVPAPEDNPTTAGKVALGKQLFFDPRLSGNNQMSCATCHRPDKAFGDGLSLGKGAAGKTLMRNTPSLLNVGFNAEFHWDGRAKSLEEQALLPIQAADEMNQDVGELEKELNAVPAYVDQFRTLFGTNVNRAGIAKALAAFERTLVTGPSPYDRHLRGERDALSPEAKRGMDLFFGPAGCARCHHGPLLTDEKFYRLGFSHDKGLGSITGKPDDDYKFRTPSLRNVARTGPYMHDGSFSTLHDVLFFYLRGVPSSGPNGLSLDIETLQVVSIDETTDLVAFLEALSGEEPKIAVPDLP